MPLIPGIPPLPVGVATPVVALIASEAISSTLWQASQAPPAWGVFDEKYNQVLFPDSVLEFDNRREFDISNFPVQAGSFASYNKVIRPFEVQLRFSKAGTVSDREDFLNDLDDLVESLDLFNIVTPEKIYPSVNLQRYEVIRRGAQGAFFLTEVDAYFIQIIEVQAQYTTTAVQLPNAQSPAAQPQSNVGNVQPQTPSSQETAQGNSALGSVTPEFY